MGSISCISREHRQAWAKLVPRPACKFLHSLPGPTRIRKPPGRCPSFGAASWARWIEQCYLAADWSSRCRTPIKASAIDKVLSGPPKQRNQYPANNKLCHFDWIVRQLKEILQKGIDDGNKRLILYQQNRIDCVHGHNSKLSCFRPEEGQNFWDQDAHFVGNQTIGWIFAYLLERTQRALDNSITFLLEANSIPILPVCCLIRAFDRVWPKVLASQYILHDRRSWLWLSRLSRVKGRILQRLLRNNVVSRIDE